MSDSKALLLSADHTSAYMQLKPTQAIALFIRLLLYLVVIIQMR
jgi:hypothetical protein